MNEALKWLRATWDMVIELESEVNEMLVEGLKGIWPEAPLVKAKIRKERQK